MKRIVHLARDFREAAEWDIDQALSLTPDERRRIARELRKRVYGSRPIDVRRAERLKRSEKKK
jgi:hypothetical protein